MYNLQDLNRRMTVNANKCHCYWNCLNKVLFCLFVFRGQPPGCHLFGTASMLEWLRKLLSHHSQGSSMERWSRNTPRVVTAKVFYTFGGSLTSPFIFNNSVKRAAPFNVVSHPRCCERIN